MSSISRFSGLQKFGVSLLALLGVSALLAGALSSLAAATDVVQNIVVTPYNSGAIVTWNALPGASSYEVSYGTSSVAEGFATGYDTVTNVPAGTAFTISGLTNGVKYYLATKAVLVDGKKSGAFSEEAAFTPSSIYSHLPASDTTLKAAAGTPDTTAPVVESALALTKTLVRIKFSEPVKLPEVLPEVSFTLTKNQDMTQNIAVSKVEYKTDYAGQANAVVHKDTVWVTLPDPLLADAEYTITVSASVTDEAGNPLESGVTDYALFTGIDRTEIPAEEKALTGSVPSPADIGTTPLGTTPEPTNTSAPLPDTSAPENITDFTISNTPQEKDFALHLLWQKSTSTDVTDQHLYQDSNAQGFGPWISLGKDTEKYDTMAAPESEIRYKITAVDQAGNENSGVIASVRLPALPSSGAPLGLLALGFSFAASGLRKLRKK